MTPVGSTRSRPLQHHEKPPADDGDQGASCCPRGPHGATHRAAIRGPKGSDLHEYGFLLGEPGSPAALRPRQAPAPGPLRRRASPLPSRTPSGLPPPALRRSCLHACRHPALRPCLHATHPRADARPGASGPTCSPFHKRWSSETQHACRPLREMSALPVSKGVSLLLACDRRNETSSETEPPWHSSGTPASAPTTRTRNSS